jgi:ABC-2 type transport system permease protein
MTTGAIFTETVRRGWRGMLGWGMGLGALLFVQMIALPDDQSLEQMTTLVASMPSFLIQGLMGGADISVLSTPTGFLVSRFFSFALLMYGFYAVVQGLTITANEEESGIMTYFLSLPIPRWRIFAEKIAAIGVLFAGVLAITFGFILAGSATVSSVEYDIPAIVLLVVLLWLPMMTVCAFTLFVAALLRRRGTAVAAAGAFVVISYFLNFLANGAPDSIWAQLNMLSFFNYFDPVSVITDGASLTNVIVLLTASAALIAGGIALYQRRDVGL